MSALTESLIEQLSDLVERAASLRSKGMHDLAKIVDDQCMDVQKRLNEANEALERKQVLKG